jgi:hypothetical protein
VMLLHDGAQGRAVINPALDFLWAHRYLVRELLLVGGGAGMGVQGAGMAGPGGPAPWRPSIMEESDECIEERRLLLDGLPPSLPPSLPTYLHTCIHTYRYMHAYTHAYIHTQYIHACMHACMSVLKSVVCSLVVSISADISGTQIKHVAALTKRTCGSTN